MAKNHNYVRASEGHGTKLPGPKKYKGGSVPIEALSNRPGKTERKPYSGPPVAKHDRGG